MAGGISPIMETGPPRPARSAVMRPCGGIFAKPLMRAPHRAEDAPDGMTSARRLPARAWQNRRNPRIPMSTPSPKSLTFMSAGFATACFVMTLTQMPDARSETKLRAAEALNGGMAAQQAEQRGAARPMKRGRIEHAESRLNHSKQDSPPKNPTQIQAMKHLLSILFVTLALGAAAPSADAAPRHKKHRTHSSHVVRHSDRGHGPVVAHRHGHRPGPVYVRRSAPPVPVYVAPPHRHRHPLFRILFGL